MSSNPDYGSRHLAIRSSTTTSFPNSTIILGKYVFAKGVLRRISRLSSRRTFPRS